MPYVRTPDRDELEPILQEFERYLEGSTLLPGCLNYLISSMVDLTALEMQESGKKVGYTFYNEIIGVLECVKLELYRRATAPYEDQARENNGEVYYHQNRD